MTPMRRTVAEIECASAAGARSGGESDDEIAEAARSNPAAFEDLYRRHHLSVFRFLRARTKSDDDAAELTAVAFERALQAVGRYRPAGGGFLAWLFTIARNAALDMERARHRHGTKRLSELDPTDIREPLQTEDDLVRKEQLAELRSRVSTLPDAQREAIGLRYAGGLTAREIGATLGKSEAATQKLLSRALEALRETYREDA
jgi:RNA polymerase sigma-70 factor (ECF subfamily)